MSIEIEQNKKYYTDYPIEFMDDNINEPTPMREIIVSSFDGNKYCQCYVFGHFEKGLVNIKSGYIYNVSSHGKKINCISKVDLENLLITTDNN